MAESPKSTEPSTSAPGPATLQHNVPLPKDLEKSKLDWLLQINEQFFEAELRTVVSNFQFSPISIILSPLEYQDFSNNFHSLLNIPLISGFQHPEFDS